MHPQNSRGKIVLSAILLILFANVFVIYASFAYAQETPHWTYEGEEGPENWGELDEAFALCSEGKGQSPIDVTGETPVNLVNISFNYAESALNIFNNGHTIQVNYDAGSSITYNETTYDLAQFHFHHPSEHTINGEPADMEIHFVHRSASGNLAVVGVMLMVGDEVDADYDVVFDNLPTEKGEPQPTDLTVNAADLLPETQTYFTYSGSLTTPPCSEGVRWLLMTTPVMISAEQAEAFGGIFELNARPVQPLNMRDLLVDSEA